MNIIRHIKVDLYGDTQHFAVAAKQMDMGTRYVGVTLLEDGVVYEIPDNAEIIINMTKPDKTHVHNDGEKSGNEALVPLTRGMLMVHGTAQCEIQLYQNGALLTSATSTQTQICVRPIHQQVSGGSKDCLICDVLHVGGRGT